ncbi:MAG: hypothetical protein QXR82_02430 [Candidatus Bathyarchaeia archaeon]
MNEIKLTQKQLKLLEVINEKKKEAVKDSPFYKEYERVYFRKKNPYFEWVAFIGYKNGEWYANPPP